MSAPAALTRLSDAARREAGFIATSRAMLLALVVVPLCAIAIIAAMLSQGALQSLPVGVVDNARTSESQALVRLLSGRPGVRIAAQPVSDTAADQMGAPLSEALRPLTALVILIFSFLVGSGLVSRLLTNADEPTT